MKSENTDFEGKEGVREETRVAPSFVPLRVVTRAGSKAARYFANTAEPRPDLIAPGFPPTPNADLVDHGGRTIRDLSFLNFYVAGQTAWDASDIQNIDRALAAAMSDRNLNNVVMQYFQNQRITSTFLGSHRLSGDAPAIVSQGDVEALVVSLAKQGALSGADFRSTVVNLLLPRGTVLTSHDAVSEIHQRLRVDQAEADDNEGFPVDDAQSSKDELGGYHGSVHLTMSGVGQTFYYAVGVFSEIGPDGVENGLVAFPEPWKSVVATLYHELNEARTDPDIEDAIRTHIKSLLGWTAESGDECGDFPVDLAGSNRKLVFHEVPLTDGSGNVPVQFLYSNAVHGPEGPISEPHS